MFEVYHATFANDDAAVQAMKEMSLPNGCEILISRSFGHGSAVLVLTVPAGTDMTVGFGNHNWTKVGTKTVPTKTEESEEE